MTQFPAWPARRFDSALLYRLILTAGAFALPANAVAQHLKIEKVETPALEPGSPLFPAGSVILDGVGASAFRPALWKAGTVFWVADLQYPLFSAKPGKSRNIYAASSVEEPWGWRIFYSAWDGTPTHNDCLYEGKTKDFLTITDRQMVVSHGEFLHVSNASAQKLADGSYELLGTSEGGINNPGPVKVNEKPAVFESKNGESFNGDKIPYEAKGSDNLSILSYPEYETASFNGANVLFRDNDRTRFIFHEYSHDKQNVYWAEGKDPWHLTVGGKALQTINSPNDMRKFTVAGKDWYILALYRKADVGGWGGRDTEHLWYSLSNDARTFGPEQHMTDAVGRPDRFIFSVNFVSRGDRLLGILYGSSENALTNSNSIFAKWIQKRPLLVATTGKRPGGNGGIYPSDGALGPDRQRFTLPEGKPFDGKLDLFDDDGKTPLGSVTVHLEPGSEYRITY